MAVTEHTWSLFLTNLLVLCDCSWLSESQVAQTIKNLPIMWETWVQSLSWEDLLENEMAAAAVAAKSLQSCPTLCNPIPWAGFKRGSPALQAWSVNHWTTREVPWLVFYVSLFPDLDLCDTICIYSAIVIIYLALSVYQCARPLINSFTLLLSSLQRTIYLKPIKLKLHNPLSQASSKTLTRF